MNALSPPEKAKPQGETMSLSATARTVGVSRTTLYAWLVTGKFPRPVLSPGGRPRFRTRDVQAFLDALPVVGAT